MSGKGARARYLAQKADVADWVNYAFYSGDHTNPYPETDRRNRWFKRLLDHTACTDHNFRELHWLHGGDVNELVKRPYPKPTFKTIESFYENPR